MPPPTNTTAATALTVTANESITIDMPGGLDPDFTLSLRYTTRVGEILMRAYAHAASTYAPWCTIYTGTPAALLPYDEIGESSDARRPKMIPVTLVPIPTDFYFAVQQDTLDPIPAVTLTFTVFSKSRTTVPAGAILVPSDGEHFPLVALSPTTGEIYGHKAFAVGEAGTQLVNGVAAHTNKVTGGVTLYNADLSVLAEIPPGTIATGNVSRIATDRTSLFYISFPGTVGNNNAKIYIVNASGALVTTLTFSAYLTYPAVRRDNTILYFVKEGAVVRRWDLINSVFLADLYTPPSNHIFAADILVLADNSVLVPIRQTVSPYATSVVRLNDAGTVLNTIALGGGLIAPGVFGLNRTAYAFGDLSFIVWERDGSATERFREIDALTGAELSSATEDGFDIDGDSDKAPYDGMAPFGNQTSCPVFVAMQSFITDAPLAPSPGPRTSACWAALPLDRT